VIQTQRRRRQRRQRRSRLGVGLWKNEDDGQNSAPKDESFCFHNPNRPTDDGCKPACQFWQELNTVSRRWLKRHVIGFVCAALSAKYKHRKILGETIRAFREKAEMSQELLAECSDLHHNYLGEVERGEKAATIDTLVKIAKGLRLGVSDLVRDV
jgi:DNA-binding XRE family transcriptional regulator